MLSWMMPIYLALVLPVYWTLQKISRGRLRPASLFAWSVGPLLTWWMATQSMGRQPAFLNAFLEPLALGAVAAGLLLWVRLPTSRPTTRDREPVGLLALILVSVLVGCLFPVLGESP